MAERILEDIRLVDKLLIIKKKIINKINAIIKNYKNIKIKVEGSS